MEEGYDINHMANCGKYISAMVAAAARMLYAMDPTPVRLALAIIACSGATMYQLYWDFVKDWGLLNPKSKNFFLRDQLILKKKSVYYFSMVRGLSPDKLYLKSLGKHFVSFFLLKIRLEHVFTIFRRNQLTVLTFESTSPIQKELPYPAKVDMVLIHFLLYEFIVTKSL